MARTLLALLLLAPAALADPEKELNPFKWEVGQVGLLPEYDRAVGDRPAINNPQIRYSIRRVEEMAIVIRMKTPLGDDLPPDFVVKGIDTKGLIDGRPWKPEGRWKVSGTAKLGRKTLMVIEPAPKK